MSNSLFLLLQMSWGWCWLQSIFASEPKLWWSIQKNSRWNPLLVRYCILERFINFLLWFVYKPTWNPHTLNIIVIGSRCRSFELPAACCFDSSMLTLINAEDCFIVHCQESHVRAMVNHFVVKRECYHFSIKYQARRILHVLHRPMSLMCSFSILRKLYGSQTRNGNGINWWKGKLIHQLPL